MKNRPQHAHQRKRFVMNLTSAITLLLMCMVIGCVDSGELKQVDYGAGDVGYSDAAERADAAGNPSRDVGGTDDPERADVGDFGEVRDAAEAVDVAASMDVDAPMDAAKPVDVEVPEDPADVADPVDPVDVADPVDPVVEECDLSRSVEVLALVNGARAQEGIAALRCDVGLARAARLHAEDMCSQNYFSHDSKDGRKFSDRIRAQGVSYRTIGENIANGYGTPANVHQGWMNSPGHRRNIMNPNYDRIGVGYAKCPNGTYWTQTFAG